MSPQEHAAAEALLDHAAELAATSFPDTATARLLVDAVAQTLSPAELARHAPEELAAIAVSLWQFAALRPSGTALLRVTADGGAIQIVNDDMRFLVDSTEAAIAGLGLVVDLVIHPVLSMQRDTGGRLLACAAASEVVRESVMHIALETPVPADRVDAVMARLHQVLADVRAAVSEWPTMRADVREIAAAVRATPHLATPDFADDAALLDWLDDDNFLFLGTRRYTLDDGGLNVVAGAGHGLLRRDDFLVFDGLRALTRASPDVQAFLRSPAPTMISKSNRRSDVHRPVPMDTVLVKSFDAASQVIGLSLILGLFTTDSYSRLPHEIPVLRRKVARCMQRSGFAPDSRDGRALQHILDTFPRDELFQIDEDQLFETAIGVLHLKRRPSLALFVMQDPFERFVTCLVYLPRDRFDAEAGRRIAAILEQATGGTIRTESTHFDFSPLARLHFVIATMGGAARTDAGAIDVAAIERQLIEALRNWMDRLGEALARVHGPSTGQQRLRRVAFPPEYRDRYDAAAAITDLDAIDTLGADNPVAVRLSSPGTREMRLRILHEGSPLALSDMLPMLENLGVRVIGEIPFAITLRDFAQPVWLQELELVSTGASPQPDAALRFEQAFREVWAGRVESDGFNRLVLSAGLSAREVTVLRTVCRFLRQAGSGFSQTYMEGALAAHPDIAGLLVALFVSRADPAPVAKARDAHTAAIHAEIVALLERVENLDEDRILRSFLLVILKTLRTNYFQPGKSFLSLKLASREIDLLPQPRPLVEIFVCSPRMEGCHLRGGKVARGGIRWSDRREDFRTEVLGLMKAQMVKNAVIVPVGSKGGFVLKAPPTAGGRDELMAEGIACYRILMSALLDLTDNFAGSDVVPPADVVRHDGDDPYLVVAADKGTATFSDIANAAAIEHGFWLGDAFASGGSIGYDHKAMGITAKGAWEAVKRHFREIGTDIQTTDFTCVGVGDMSGDVFGNAMLLSRHIRLIAAFNHMHIFLDPEPDAASSWAERARLFALPRSGWTDYEAQLISAGGGVYDRSAKSIPLSPQVQARFGLSRDSMAPAELIQALLRHDADLLWFGGIGTYVKASTESQAEAGDRANDALRIDAATLRAQVIGEGANLAVTQRGRIEFALAGGRINTDAIDNSAGVDTSDHEVNIKIAVGDVIEAGLVPAADRTAFLATMTDDVERLVLVDNTLQTLALSLAQDRAPALLDSHIGLMRAMERAGRLNRAVEFLPDDKALVRRAADRLGLTRPEIAVLLAYAKMGLYDELLASDLPSAVEMQVELLGYFPERLRELAPEVLARHRLRREIVCTVVANAMINRMGPSFVEDMRARTGARAEEVARAFLIVRDVFAMEAIWRDIAALDNQVPAATQTRLFHAIATVMDQAVRWFLLSGRRLDHALSVAAFRPGLELLVSGLPGLLPEPERQVNAARTEALVALGAPTALAQRVVTLNTLSTAMDIVEIAGPADIPAIARLYFDVGTSFGLLLLRRQARLLPAATHWQRLAADALTDDSYVQQREITRTLAAEGRMPEPGAQVVEVLGEIARTTPPDLAMLTVAARRVRSATSSPGGPA